MSRSAEFAPSAPASASAGLLRWGFPSQRFPLKATPLKGTRLKGSRLSALQLMAFLLFACPIGTLHAADVDRGASGADAPAALRSLAPPRPASGPSPTQGPVRLIVPFAAKGPTDTVARALAAALALQLNRPVVVENRAGAGGTAGAAAASRAAPDGATLLLHHVGMATAPTLYRSLPYDPRRDFEPVGRVVDVPMTLVARTGFPASGLADAIRHIRRNQNSIVMAYAGLGSASHLCGLLLSLALEVDLIQVPYRGTGPAIQDLQDNQADLMCDQTTNTIEPIRNGRIRALGVAGPRRLQGMPMVPALAEAGIRGFDLSIWHGLFAPRGTPPPLLDRLAQALRAALSMPAFVRAMHDLQVVVATPEQAGPAGLGALLAAETARWAPILARAGQYAD